MVGGSLCLGVRISTSSAGRDRAHFATRIGDGRCHMSCEVVGDPSDPMTTERTAIFKPLGLELTRPMEAAMGRSPEDAGSVDLPPGPPEAKEVIESGVGSPNPRFVPSFQWGLFRSVPIIGS